MVDILDDVKVDGKVIAKQVEIGDPDSPQAAATKQYVDGNIEDLAEALGGRVDGVADDLSTHVADVSNPHNVTKEQLGLENVDNTSDVNKPISTDTQEALDTKADKTTVSYLRMEFDEEVKVRSEEDTNIRADLFTKADKVETQNALKDKANKADVETALDSKADKLATEQALDSKADKSIMETALGLKADKSDVETALDTKADKTVVSSLSNTLTKEIQDRVAGDNTNATAISTHATNKSNPHGVTKEQVGLGNVDNTADIDKPISTATQNALNLKADKSEISSLYRPKGSVATYNDLPTNAQIGDVYDVQSTGMNYVWTGSKWDELGAIIDLSPYYTKTDVDSALSGKVSKSGDAMSDTLTIVKSEGIFLVEKLNEYANGNTLNKRQVVSNYVHDKNNTNISDRFTAIYPDNSRTCGISLWDESRRYGQLYVQSFNDGTFCGIAPSWSVGTNDNSDKLLTIKMANSLPSLIHSTGNETKDGVLSLTSNPIVLKNSDAGLTTKSETFDRSATFTSYTRNVQYKSVDKNGEFTFIINGYAENNDRRGVDINLYGKDGTTSTLMLKHDGTNKYAMVSGTPSTATGNEVATASWSLGKFVKKTGDTMTGELLANGGVRSNFIRKLQSDGQNVAFVLFEETETSNIASLNARKSTGTDTAIYPALKLFANSDATYYATLTSNYIGWNDNSDKVLTIKMANSLPSLLHSTGNETVAGSKVFSTPVTDPQNQSGRIVSPNSDASVNPFYKVASISFDDFAAWDTPTLTLDVERGWYYSSLQNFCTFRAYLSTDGSKNITSARFSKILSSGQASDTLLQGDHWWMMYNATLKEVQIWAKNEYNQLNLNYRVRMSGRRYSNFANWKLHSSTGVASLPSADDGWTILQADDVSNRMTFSTPADATGQEIVTADWSLGKFVKKTGDTMSDNLIIAKGGVSTLILKRTDVNKDQSTYKQLGVIRADASNGMSSQIEFLRNTPLGYLASGVIISAYNSTGTQQSLSLYSFDEGVGQEAYVQHPSWSVGTNDNSDKSLTIKMANSLPSLVHTTGNETISGVKTHTSYIQSTINSGTIVNATFGNYTNGDTPTASLLERTYRYEDKAGTRIGQLVYSIQSTKQRNFGLTLFNESQGYKFLGIKVLPDGTFTSECCPTKAEATGNEIATANWVNTNFIKKTGGKVTESIAFTGQVGNTQTEAGVYLGLDTNASAPNANMAIVSANTAAYIDMGAPNEDYGFRIIKWRGVSDDLAQLCYSNANITIPRQNGTMALKSDIPTITASTTDIGEGSALATGTLYLVYE